MAFRKRLLDSNQTSPPLDPLRGGRPMSRARASSIHATGDRVLRHGRRLLLQGGPGLAGYFAKSIRELASEVRKLLRDADRDDDPASIRGPQLCVTRSGRLRRGVHLRHLGPALAWVITGGESGPGARSCNLAWLRSLVEQCDRARVACFVKQLGARPDFAEPLAGGGQSIESMLRHGEYEEDPIVLRDRKGGDPAEWPEDLRVRQFPEARHVP